MVRPLLLALAAALGLAACDSTTLADPVPGTPSSPPTPATPGEGVSVVFAGPTAETVGVEGGRDLAFALGSLFRANTAAGELMYTASPTGGTIAARIDGDSLRVTLNSIGSGFVTVIATGQGGVRASGNIPVRVIGRCPPLPAAGLADYFPLEVGTVWSFNYRYNERRNNSNINTYIGISTITALAVTCSQGGRTYRVREDLQTNLYIGSKEYIYLEDTSGTIRMPITQPGVAQGVTIQTSIQGARYATPGAPGWLVGGSSGSLTMEPGVGPVIIGSSSSQAGGFTFSWSYTRIRP